MASSGTANDRWLYGPARDLLLGCGGLYAVFFVLFAAAGAPIREAQPAVLAPLLIVLASTPHYGATLLRVYEQGRDRRAYAYFTVWITLALLLLFVAGVYNDVVASLMLTVYLTWSPWHYTGQNYGIGVMLLRRGGVEVTRTTQRFVYASFIFSYALTFVALHDGSGDVTDTLVGYGGSGVHFLSLGIPERPGTIAIVVLGLAWLGATVVAAARLLRVAAPAALLPLGCLWLTQALWFGIPLAIRGLGVVTPVEPLANEWRPHYFVWIAVGHAVQYLWVTSYYAKAGSSWHGMGRWYAKALIAGNAAWAVPVLLFMPDGIGRLSYDGGLALTVASLVNLHHFVLDGAIWKLRSSRIAGVLIRSAPDPADDAPIGPTGGRAPWRRRLAWIGMATVLTLSAAEFWERHVHRPAAAARGAFDRVRDSLDRTAWVGRDSAAMRVQLGNAFARAGDYDQAAAAYLRSLALRPNSQALDGIGMLLLYEKRYAEALRYFEAALEESPESPGIMLHASRALAALGETARSEAMLARARAIDPEVEARVGGARAGGPRARAAGAGAGVY